MTVKSEVFRCLLVAGVLLAGPGLYPALAQEPAEPQEQAEAQDQGQEAAGAVSEAIVVTGSRIPQSPLDEPVPVLKITEEDLERSGLTNLGAALQRLPVTGSAINTRFNVPGNSGFPQDGNGIGAGAVELSLRNVGAKRTLILVDGRRWIAGASASGVPSAVDLNTLPANAIKRIALPPSSRGPRWVDFV